MNSQNNIVGVKYIDENEKSWFVAKRKDKYIAVTLALFTGGLGFWLYTYEKNKVKFWVNFILAIITFSIWILVALIWGLIEAEAHDESWYDLYYARGD